MTNPDPSVQPYDPSIQPLPPTLAVPQSSGGCGRCDVGQGGWAGLGFAGLVGLALRRRRGSR